MIAKSALIQVKLPPLTTEVEQDHAGLSDCTVHFIG